MRGVKMNPKNNGPPHLKGCGLKHALVFRLFKRPHLKRCGFSFENKKAESSSVYLGQKTVNVVLSVIVALFIVFLIGVLVYGYLDKETDLQKAGKQMQNIIEKIDVVKERIGDNLIIYPPENWFLKSDKDATIKDDACYLESCLCFCKDASCEGERICQGFDFIVEVDERYREYGGGGNAAGVAAGYQENTMRLQSIEKLRLDFVSIGDEVDKIRIKREVV